jgi:hypothetical protein
MTELSAEVTKERIKAEAKNLRKIRMKIEKTYHLMTKKRRKTSSTISKK